MSSLLGLYVVVVEETDKCWIFIVRYNKNNFSVPTISFTILVQI